MYIEKGEFQNTNRNFSLMRCNHCDDSPYTNVFPVTALWERDDGIIDFGTDRCIGCEACVSGCQYGALYIDPETSMSPLTRSPWLQGRQITRSITVV